MSLEVLKWQLGGDVKKNATLNEDVSFLRLSWVLIGVVKIRSDHSNMCRVQDRNVERGAQLALGHDEEEESNSSNVGSFQGLSAVPSVVVKTDSDRSNICGVQDRIVK